MFSLIKKTTIVDVISGWIASFLIGQISMFMALALVKFDVNGEMAAKKIMFKKQTTVADDWHKMKKWVVSDHLNMVQKMGMLVLIVVNRVVMLSYHVVYFYFNPLFIVVFVHLSDL